LWKPYVPLRNDGMLLLLLLLLYIKIIYLFKEGRILETLNFVFAITQSAFFINNALNNLLVYLFHYEDRYDLILP
jgi:hypothetical protein